MSANPATLQLQNLAARNAVLASATELIQKVPNGQGNYNPATTNVITINPIMAGLTKGFYIDVVLSIVNLGLNTLYLTEQGVSNIFSAVDLVDTNSLHRIQTDAFHIALVNFLRFKTPLGSTHQQNSISDITNFGNNYNTTDIPASIATNTASTPAIAKFTLYIPCAYAGNDLRGAIYTNVTNASMNLQLSINPYPFSTTAASSAPVSSGVPVQTLYANASTIGTTGAYISNIQISTRQVYLINLPAWNNSYDPMFNQGGLLLPAGDLSVYYQLIKSYPSVALSAGAQAQLPYAPQRSYLTTLLVYDNGQTLNNGTDINEINIEAANQQKFLQATPAFLSELVENEFHMDLPNATYLLNRRHSPINTIAYGNMYIIFEPSVVNAGAKVIQYDEFFSYAGVTNQAQAA